MYTLLYQFNKTPDANGVHEVTYQLLDNKNHCVCRREITYTARLASHTPNELKTRIMQAIRMRIKAEYGICNALKSKCLNPETDFIPRKKMVQPCHKKEEQPASSHDERCWELVEVQSSSGESFWTIQRCQKKLYTEQEAKEELFRLQFEGVENA